MASVEMLMRCVESCTYTANRFDLMKWKSSQLGKDVTMMESSINHGYNLDTFNLYQQIPQ